VFTLKDLENKMIEKMGHEEVGMLNIKADLAIKLQQARTAQNLTQAELATRSGLKQSAIARLETQGTAPRIDTVYKVAQALGMEITLVPCNKIDNAQSTDVTECLKRLASIISEQRHELRLLRNRLGLLRNPQACYMSRTRGRDNYEPQWGQLGMRNTYYSAVTGRDWVNLDSFGGRRNVSELLKKGLITVE